MYINTNVSSIKAQNSLGKNNAAMAKAMERLSSGLRINSAADDAAGSAVSVLMSKQIGGMKTAIRNANDGVSLVQTAESAITSISNILLRMRDLSIQASNGTYSVTDKDNIQLETAQLLAEIKHISETTDHNSIMLLDASVTSIAIQMSDAANDKMTITLYDTKITSLGGATGKLNTINVADATSTLFAGGDAQKATVIIDEAIDQLASYRADFGAAQNRLEYSISNLDVNVTNVSAARSRIQDADMTAEMSEMSKQKILSQAAMNMLGQANQMTQSVVQLLQQGA